MNMSEPLELVIVIDSLGDYAVGKDIDSAREAYEEQIQALSEAEGFRVLKVAVRVPLPEPIEATVDVAGKEERVEITVK